MFSPVGISGRRCPVCGAGGGSSQTYNSYQTTCGQTSYMSCPPICQLGADQPVISAQTDKIIQLRHELKQQSGNQGYSCSTSNYFPPGNFIQSSICDEYPSVLSKPSDEKTFQFDRYVPYDHIHADIEACSIKPKPRKNPTVAKKSYSRNACSSNDKVNSAISHIDAAKRILSSA